MNVDHFECLRCGAGIGPREVRQPSFECPVCGARFDSNYRRAMRHSFTITLTIWLLLTVVGCLMSDAWQRVLLLSLELGVLASIFIGMLLHRMLTRVKLAEPLCDE